MNDILERLAHCIAGTVTPEDRDAITLEACAEIARLRLTDAERMAIKEAMEGYGEWMDDDGVLHKEAASTVATLRGLLERIW